MPDSPATAAAGFPDRTLPALLRQQAARWGDRVLFRCGEVAWTYAEAPGIAARAAGRLAEAGIRAGDRVALMAANRAEMLEAVLGCLWLGAIAVPVNTANRGPGLRHVLDLSGARLVIAD